jgi:hypothetical protein
MENIIEPSIDFDFTKLYLANPTALSGGAYFTRMFLNNKPIYIQTPKCLTKQGFVKSGKKNYTDLMFTNNDTLIIQWLENLESKCHDLIHSKSNSWFDNSLEKSDIESAFTSPIKIFKSGKFYLLRVSVKPNVKIYNETDEIVSMETINPETNIISILEIQGIKFTSRYFQIEIELKQSMVVSPDPFLDECFIKKPLNRNNDSTFTVIKNETNNFKSNNILTEQYTDLNIDFKEHETENENENENDDALINLANENIQIDVEDLNEPNFTNELTEFKLSDTAIGTNTEPLTLKKPNEVYYKIYKTAREKAKVAKKEAIIAFLEAKNIKTTYMLEDIVDSDSDNDSDTELDNLYNLK